jgi:hypothetical protein
MIYKKDNQSSLGKDFMTRQKIQIVVKHMQFLHTNNEVSHEKWKSTSPQARLG